MVFSNLLEWQQFGFNLVTVSFLATLFFSGFEGWGLFRQHKLIWHLRSGRSLAKPMFIYLTFMFAAALVYGIEIRSLAVCINGLLFVIYATILYGLKKFDGFTQYNWILFSGCCAVLSFMLFSPFKTTIFLILSSGGILAIAAQLIELWKNKVTGAIEIRLILVYFLSSLFWITYSVSIFNWPLMVITIVSAGLLGWIIYLWICFHCRAAAFIAYKGTSKL